LISASNQDGSPDLSRLSIAPTEQAMVGGAGVRTLLCRLDARPASKPAKTGGMEATVLSTCAGDARVTWAREVPLVGPRVHRGRVQEDGIARFAATSLQGKRDEVPEAALGKEVLTWKEPVVARQVDLCPSDHGFPQKNGSQPAGLRSSHGRGEEDPNVASGARSRSLQRSRDAARFGDREECLCVERPTLPSKSHARNQQVSSGSSG